MPAINGDDGVRFEAMRKIAQYLLASREVRAAMPFNLWEATDNWTPGEDEGW